MGLTWVGGFVGGLLVGVLWGCLFSLWPWYFPFFPFSFLFYLCYWGLRGSEPWGCLDFSFFFISIFFSLWTLGHFLNIEHDIALLHTSTYIAERWHRAHGLCMCWRGEALIFNELYTNPHILVMAPSGGSTFLGTQAYDVHDFLTITQEDILN